MAIKLVVDDSAFVHAFGEFRETLAQCEVVVVLAHSLRDHEVVRTIQDVFASHQNNRFKILVVDRYLEYRRVIQDVRTASRSAMVTNYHDIVIAFVKWDDNQDKLYKIF